MSKVIEKIKSTIEKENRMIVNNFIAAKPMNLIALLISTKNGKTTVTLSGHYTKWQGVKHLLLSLWIVIKHKNNKPKT